MAIKNDIIYKDIPDFEGLYKVSNCGDIISCERQIYTGIGDKRRIITLKEKPLKPNDNRGYKYVCLRKDGANRFVGVHQAVLWAFVGKQDIGIEVRHLNSNPSDNRLENLIYGTKSENMQDAVRLGTLVFSRSNLTIFEVNEIAKAQGTLSSIAKRFNCHQGTVHAIKTGKSFKNFIEEIEYTGRTTKALGKDELEYIRDRNNKRQDVINKTGYTINQIKRIRKGYNFIYC